MVFRHISGFQKYSTKGRVQLKSADSNISPEIRFNLFEEPDDQQRLVYAIRHMENVVPPTRIQSILRRERLIPGGLASGVRMLTAGVVDELRQVRSPLVNELPNGIA